MSKKTWFDQIILSWVGCPASVGEFETGCHTHAGNELILYITSTPRFNEWYKDIIATTWLHFTKGKEPLFPKEGIPIAERYAIFETGIAVPTYLGQHTWPKVQRFYREVMKEYKREIGELEVEQDTIRDLQNWILRALNDWMNETKRNK